MSGGGEVGGKLRPKNFRGWGGEGKARRGNMADCLLGPSASPSFHLCSSCKPKTSHLSLSHFPLGSLSPMATFRSSSLNHCRCSSNSNPSQPSLLVFSGFTFTHSLSLSLYVFIYNNNNNNNNNNNFRFCTGGTAFNGVVEELKNFTTRVAHVLPVSDDGGSTAEIVRVLGKFFFLFLMNEFLVFAQQFYFMVSVHFFFPAIRWSGCWRHKVEVFEVVGSKQC